MVVASLLFARWGCSSKPGSAHFSAIELVFYRTLFGMLSIGVMVLARGQSLAARHFLPTSSAGCSAISRCSFLYFYAITQLPLATVVTLNYTSPMFLAGLSAWLLKETLRSHVVTCVARALPAWCCCSEPPSAPTPWLARAMGLGSAVLPGWPLSVRELEAGWVSQMESGVLISR